MFVFISSSFLVFYQQFFVSDPTLLCQFFAYAIFLWPMNLGIPCTFTQWSDKIYKLFFVLFILKLIQCLRMSTFKLRNIPLIFLSFFFFSQFVYSLLLIFFFLNLFQVPPATNTHGATTNTQFQKANAYGSHSYNSGAYLYMCVCVKKKVMYFKDS